MKNVNRLTYTVPEAAKAIGISVPTAYELCNCDDFPAVRISPKRIVIPVDSLNQWLMRKAEHKDA